MRKNVLPANEFWVRTSLLKVTAAMSMLLMLAITASAYTLVFRDGRRIEIPAEFTVTRTTLTYEISPGFNRTLQVTLIDVAATERANKETPGAFFHHTEETTVSSQPAPQPAVRTLTNSDLAAFRQRRIESEQAYEKRRTELGLPTVADTRKRQDDESASVREQLRERSMVEAREEAYWRGRARDLRTEIAAVDTQINYVRGRISEVNDSSLANRSVVTGVYPIWPNNRRFPNGRPFPNGPLGGYRTARPVYGPGFPYPYGYPTGPYGYPTGPYGYPNGVYGYPTGPFDNYDNSSEQSELSTRMDDLQVRRAGLLAQWQALEDEARDARIPQVWLEP